MSYQFAIAGCGHIGKRHAAHIANSAKLMAVCDIVPEKANELGGLYGCPAFYTLEDMLSAMPGLDIVNICTPNYLHEDHTVAVLNAGHHAVVEKPMAISAASCKKMITAAKSSGKEIFVVKQNRYNPPVQVVKDLIHNGALGRIVQANVNCFWNRDKSYYTGSDWKGVKQKDGGILFTQFSHFIDVLFYLLGPMKAVSGSSDNFLHDGITDFEDSAAFILRSDQGSIISFNASTCAYKKNMEGSITLLAENGSVKIGGQYMNTIEQSNIRDIILPLINIQEQNNQYGHYEGSMSNHHLVIQNVIDTLDGKSAAMTSAEEGLQVVQLIEEMYRIIN